MRTLLAVLCPLAVALLAAPAHAQYANHGLGLSAGYMRFAEDSQLEPGLFLGLEGSYYLDAGFELVSLSKLALPRDPVTGDRVVGIAPSAGLRYLFAEEGLRPYVGTDLSYLLVFKPAGTQQYMGVGPNVGLDLFVGDSTSVGARAQYNFYVRLNEPLQTSLTVSLGAATYF
jgi:outer membrane protein